MSYAIGDDVEVSLHDGYKSGKITNIFPNFAFGTETKYEIHGTGNNVFLTIASSRVIRRCE